MKQVSEMPTSGQFVAVWQLNGKILSDVLWYGVDGELNSIILDNEITKEGIDEFKAEEKITGAQYFIAD